MRGRTRSRNKGKGFGKNSSIAQIQKSRHAAQEYRSTAIDSLAPIRPDVLQVSNHLEAMFGAPTDATQKTLLACLEGKIETLGHAEAYFRTATRHDPHGINRKSKEVNISAFDNEETETNSILETVGAIDTEKAARPAGGYFEDLVWSDEILCPRCKSEDVYKMDSKIPLYRFQNLMRCRGCKKQFTAMSQTQFKGSHLPEEKWVKAIQILIHEKQRPSNNQFKRMLGVSYGTAQRVKKRLLGKKIYMAKAMATHKRKKVAFERGHSVGYAAGVLAATAKFQSMNPWIRCSTTPEFWAEAVTEVRAIASPHPESVSVAGEGARG